jgi:hypothetical protein
MPLLLTEKREPSMDIGTIIVLVIASLVFVGMIIWAIVALVAIRAARKAANSFGGAFGLDPDLRTRSIARQHERIQRWGNRS